MQMQLAADDFGRHARRAHRVLPACRLPFPPGEALVLTGPNGVGQDDPAAHHCRPPSARRRQSCGWKRVMPTAASAQHCHYVGHRDAVKSSMTVLENLDFWHSFLAKDSIDRLPGRGRRRTRRLRPAGAQRYPGRLSFRRAASAGWASPACLLAPRPLWLLDEPYGVARCGVARHARCRHRPASARRRHRHHRHASAHRPFLRSASCSWAKRRGGRMRPFFACCGAT